MDKWYVGVDLGGTNIVSGLVREDGKVAARDKRSTSQDAGLSGSLRQMKDSVRAVVAEGGIAMGDLAGIGIGSPGPLDPLEGIIIAPENLPAWRDVPLKRIFEDTFGVRTVLDNDGNVAALGEQWKGSGKNVGDFLCVTLGTGIGGGAICGGKLLKGFNGNAAEIGHITIDHNGPQCPCGNRGCLELYASATGIVRWTKVRMAQEDPETSLTLGADLTARKIFEAARDGDVFACEMFGRTGTLLGAGLVSAINLLNVSVIALGGGMADAGDLIFEPVRRTILERGLPGVREHVRVVPVELGEDAAILGAAKNAMDA
ncbi:MAG: ROK family protein [Candidatus Latescibacterota bacterium]